MKRFLIVATFGLAMLAAGVAYAGEAVATTPHFAFYSDFQTNLNDALLNAGVDRKFGRAELFRAGDEVACFEELPRPTRTAWEHAVSFYHQEISPVGFGDREQFLLRLDLSGVYDVEKEEDLTYIGIARGFLQAAAPAYEACRWEAQDAANRAWVAEVVPQLAEHEEAIAERLAKLYQRPLGGLPIRFDVMETVNWSGATTILLFPEGGHVQISIAEHGATALELVFHEASHILMGRRAPVRAALLAASVKTGVDLPTDLWHSVLFFTTGETVRQVLAETGVEYEPMMFALDGGIFSKHHEALKKGWAGYVTGDKTLPQAAEDLLLALANR